MQIVSFFFESKPKFLAISQSLDILMTKIQYLSHFYAIFLPYITHIFLLCMNARFHLLFRFIHSYRHRHKKNMFCIFSTRWNSINILIFKYTADHHHQKYIKYNKKYIVSDDKHTFRISIVYRQLFCCTQIESSFLKILNS